MSKGWSIQYRLPSPDEIEEEDTSFIGDVLAYMNSPEGELFLEVGEDVSAILDNTDVDANGARSFGTTANGSQYRRPRSALELSIPTIRSTSSRRTSSSGLSQSSLRKAIRRSSSTNSIDLPKPGSETTSGKPRKPRRAQELATLGAP